MKSSTRQLRNTLTWVIIGTAIILPIALAATSPLLAWRRPIYIAAGFAGIIALALLLIQPLLASGQLPGFPPAKWRRTHRIIGTLIVAAIAIHVAGLWLTSPPDVIDALRFSSPTPFSMWGVIAMWAVFATALLAITRRRLGLHLSTWRIAHGTLAMVIVTGSILHAMLVEGTMEPISKAALCAMALLATAKVVVGLRSRQSGLNR